MLARLGKNNGDWALEVADVGSIIPRGTAHKLLGSCRIRSLWR